MMQQPTVDRMQECEIGHALWVGWIDGWDGILTVFPLLFTAKQPIAGGCEYVYVEEGKKSFPSCPLTICLASRVLDGAHVSLNSHIVAVHDRGEMGGNQLVSKTLNSVSLDNGKFLIACIT